MFKKILPAVTGAIGFAIAGPAGASIGAGLGSAIRGDNPANVATNALMGYGLGALGGSAGLVGGKGLGAFASSVGTVTGLGGQAAAATVPTNASAMAAGQQGALQATQAASQPGFLAQAGKFIKDNPLTSGALGLGAIGAMGGFDEDEEGVELPPMPTAGSQGSLDVSTPGVTYYDPSTEGYGAAAPTYRTLKDGGFPRKTGQISGPGTEKSDDIPAMLSDGEFVMTAKAVRGLGALKGAKKGDKLEQRRQGAKMMYDMMDKLESKVA